MVGRLAGREDIQRDPVRFEMWVCTNLMKSNKVKCKVWCLGWGNPKHKYRPVVNGLRAALKRKTWGWVLVNKKLDMSQHCTCSPESQLCPGLCPKQHDQQGEGVILLLYSALVRPHLQCCIQLWGYTHNKGVDLME